MKFTQTNEQIFPEVKNISVSENNIVYICVYPVLFGFRVRSGFVENKSYCDLDWCAGNDWNDVENLYSMLKFILENKKEDYNCFDGLPPYSQIKPYVKDKKFLAFVSKLAKGFQKENLEK